MSKVVRGAARALNKVRKGIWNATKKFAKSKLGKVIIGAALVYFGGAALMGGLSTVGTSTSFLSGMSSGLPSAATGIGNAFTALTQGNLSGAGSALSQGFTGTAGTAAQGAATAANAAAATPGMSMAPQSIVSPAQAAITQATGGAPMSMAAPAGMAPAAGAGAGAASPGILSSIMGNKYVAPTLIQGAFQLGGAALAKKEAADADEATRARYNANIGGFRY